MQLIAPPPAIPSHDWLRAFAKALMAMKPGLPFENAVRCAVLAHAGTWLLEPEEAAEWWLAALKCAVRQDVQRLPGDLLG